MPNFRHRLSRAQQREYDRSNAVGSVPFRIAPRLVRAVQLLELTLSSADHARTQKVAQVICDEVCVALRVPPLPVVVKGRRPSDARGELHGLYESSGRRRVISVWMYTAKRQQVVAFKTFLRILVHEICHHLDYNLLELDESFHTDGFFRRESSVVHQLLKAAATAPRVRLVTGGAPVESQGRGARTE